MPIPLSIIYERSLSVKEENKNIILSFRVTPEEKVWIEEHSYGHYRRISDFVRDCIFKKEIVNIDGADEIAHELQRIGNNLNQLTRAVNAGFVRAVDLGETKQEVQKVWQSLRHYRAIRAWHTCLRLFRQTIQKFLSVALLQPANFCIV